MPLPGVGVFTKFFGRTVSEASGVAAGLAVSETLQPVLQQLVNESWKLNAYRPLKPEEAAAIAAEDPTELAWARGEAELSGTDTARFNLLYAESQEAPGIEQLYSLWRRNLITSTDFEHGLRKAKYEARWTKPLEDAKNVLLSSEELAMMQQQGFVPESRANSEGLLQGVTNERQQLRFEASGLPPGIIEALRMWRRGIIDKPTFAQIVREGHTKTKYTAALEQLKEEVLSANDYVTHTLRGWSDTQHMYAGGELTGHTNADMDILFENHGRPLSWHQVFIGLRRGGTYNGPTAAIDPAFLHALRQSDIRPEWYNLAWAQRYTYPAAFVLRALTQSGDISQAEANDILLFEGWEPQLAKTVSAKWASGSAAAAKAATVTDLLSLYDGGKADESSTRNAIVALGYSTAEAQQKLDTIDAKRVSGAKSSAIGDLHTKYKKGELPDANVISALHGLGVHEWAAPLIVAAWREFLSAEGGSPPATLNPAG